GIGVSQELGLLRLVDLADELHIRMAVDQRLDGARPKGPIDFVYLGGNLELHAEATSDFDGAVRPFFRRDSPEEREIIASWRLDRTEQVERQAVMNRADPIDRRHWQALMVGDGDERRLAEGAVEGLEVGQIEAPVQCGHRGRMQTAHGRQVNEIEVEVDDVELMRPFENLIQHDDVVRNGIDDIWIETQGRAAGGNELRLCDRIS